MIINNALDENGYESAEIVSGEYFITKKQNQYISTLLGSCIAVCARDPELKIGGMNHFMLPGDPKATEYQYKSARYGLFAMELLLNALYKNGARKDRLEIKIFGGADVNEVSKSIGRINIEFIRNFLKQDGYRITKEDLGGDKARKIHYFPYTGKVMMKAIAREAHENQDLIQKELEYIRLVKSEPIAGEVDLF